MTLSNLDLLTLKNYSYNADQITYEIKTKKDELNQMSNSEFVEGKREGYETALKAIEEYSKAANLIPDVIYFIMLNSQTDTSERGNGKTEALYLSCYLTFQIDECEKALYKSLDKRQMKAFKKLANENYFDLRKPSQKMAALKKYLFGVLVGGLDDRKGQNTVSGYYAATNSLEKITQEDYFKVFENMSGVFDGYRMTVPFHQKYDKYNAIIRLRVLNRDNSMFFDGKKYQFQTNDIDIYVMSEHPTRQVNYRYSIYLI